MDVPRDVLVEILLRLSPVCRRRLRLVCRLWRDLIQERTPETRTGPARPLIETEYRRAYVVHDVQGRGRCAPLWPKSSTGHEAYLAMELVGTCNGLLCLCDNNEPGGAIALANPATGEALRLPPTPGAGGRCRRLKIGWHLAYGFAYHSVTGRYTVVRVPFDGEEEEDKVRVLVLGEASWRDVPAPAGARCRLDAGVVGLDGAAYWVAVDEQGAERVMSFDLEDECVEDIASSPPERVCHLAEVGGRLAAVVSDGVMTQEKVQVWVLEGGGRMERRWEHRYSVQLPGRGLRQVPRPRPGQRLARPHLGHGASVILTHGTWTGERLVVYEDNTPESSPSPGSSVAVQNQRWKPRPLDCNFWGPIYRTFAYTETTEPIIGAYKLW